MNVRTVLLCLFCTAACVCSWGDQSALRLIPADITFVYSFNVRQAEKSEIEEMFSRGGLRELELLAQAQDITLKEETGSVTIGVREARGNGKNEISCYTVVNGNFSRNTVSALSGEKKGGVPVIKQDYLGMSVFRLESNNMCVCFLNRYTLVSGSAESVKEMIQIRKRKAQSVSDSAWMHLIPQAERNSVMWGAFSIDPDLKEPEIEVKENVIQGINLQIQAGKVGKPGKGNKGGKGHGRGRGKKGGGHKTGVITGHRSSVRRSADSSGSGSGGGSDAELIKKELDNIASVHRQIGEYTALGIDARALLRVRRDGSTVPCMQFMIFLEYGSKEKTVALYKGIKQAQNFFKTAIFREGSIDTAKHAFTVGMLADTQAQAGENVLKMQYICERERFAEIKKEFFETFLKGFQNGLNTRSEQVHKQAAEKGKWFVKGKNAF